MAKALNPFAPFWYTPRGDVGRENPTRFKIRGLDGNELGYVSPELRIDEAKRMVTGASGRGLELALQYGLLDWENFANDTGPVAYAPANFGLIAFELRSELFWRILAASHIAEEQKKT